jgi:hypothetical protein
MADVTFLTPREAIALAALVDGSPISSAELSRVLTQKTGRDVTPEATATLARSLVGQGMAERSAASAETYQATTQGRAWLVANADS